MPKDYVPAGDAPLRIWSLEVAQKLAAAPAEFGIDPEMAASLLAKAHAFAAALSAARDGLTRGKHTVFLKDQARRELVAELRQAVRQVQGTAFVTNEQRQALNLPLRGMAGMRRVAPARGPGIVVRESRERTIRVQLSDLDHPLSRGKAPTAKGAILFIATGPTPPPAGSSAWQFAGQVTRRLATITLPHSSAPETVWLSAVWYTQRGDTSPAGPAIAVNLPAMGPAAVDVRLAA